jgi:acyl transferase domain-containing protein
MIRCSEAITASYRACKIESQRPVIPNCLWVSSVYQRDIALVTDSLDGNYWHSNTVGEVLFSQALEHALHKSSFDLAVEVGAHPALKGPALQVIEDTMGHTIPYTGTLNRGAEDDKAFADTLGYIWANLAKNDVGFAAYDRFMHASDPPMLLKGLPTYPWNHERAYWHESRVSRAYRNRSNRHELLGLRRTDYSEDQISWKNSLIPEKISWLQDHRIQGQMIFPGAAYIVSAFEAARRVAREQLIRNIELTDLVFGQPLVFAAEDSRMEVLISLHGIQHCKSETTANFTYHSIVSSASGPMTLNAHCQLTIHYGESDGPFPKSSTNTHFGMRNLDSDQIYESFAKHGYHYTGPFRSLTSVSRRLGLASGLIQLPPEAEIQDPLMHPATLDAAMHSIMIAHSHPGDGLLTTTRVPTGVSKISLYLPAALQSASHRCLKFVSKDIDDGKCAEGRVSLCLPDSGVLVLGLEGLRTKPVLPATQAHDVHMFSETVWGPAYPSLNSEPDGLDASRDPVQLMASAAEQLSHRYPGMHILGMNASGGSDDVEILLSGLDHAFASYTHTDVSGEGPDLGRSVFASLNDKITYRKLSTETDVVDQGFATHSYDLVVAFSMPSTRLELHQTLKGVKHLLRPGGYFLCPQSIGSLLASCTSAEQAVTPDISCNSGQPGQPSDVRGRVLEEYGFADIVEPSQEGNTRFHQNYSGVTLIQAVDDRIHFLRDPLSAPLHDMQNSLDHITLIGGATSTTSACADRLVETLQAYTSEIARANSIPSLVDTKIRSGGGVIILQDHDQPLFDDFNESALAGLKRLFATSTNVLWITHGYKRNMPHARMLVAFARCVVQEMAHVRLQILDFETPDALDAGLVSKDFLRLLGTARWEESGGLDDVLWSVEPEIAYEGGCVFVPRVKPSRALNDRYNSARRTIIRDQVLIQPIDHGELFQSDRTYWLVGLTGDLGLSLCQWMITKGARHIILSSRSPKVDSAWLAHFRSSGATVKVLTCDVTDYKAVEATLVRIESDMPPIAGVCHGAMVLQDALFHDLDMARVSQVLEPKVNGAVNLNRAFSTRSLDFFILLSSIAAVTGNPGQSIYAAANGFLAGLAAQRRARGECASTINMGAILGAGATQALTSAQHKVLEKAGVMWTSEQDFHTAFAEAVVASRPCSDRNGEFTTGVRICDSDAQFKPKHASSAVFSHMMLHKNAVAQSKPSTSPTESVRAQLLHATDEDTVFRILEGMSHPPHYPSEH